MNFNDRFEKALAQARELQRTVGEALLKANDQLHPLVQESVKQAQDLQTTLSKHAAETGAIAQKQTQTAMEYLNQYIRTGSEALRQSAEQARGTVQQMAEQSRRVADAATNAMKQPPGGGTSEGSAGPGSTGGNTGGG